MQIRSRHWRTVQEHRRRQATTGCLPVSCEILSDITTPIEALRILKHVSTHCYLLESAASQ